jgi:hypothetical protein
MLYPFPLGNTLWKPADVIALLCQPGYMSPDDWRPITGCAVVLAESGGDPLARGKTIWKPGTKEHLSIDLGMFQLNTANNVEADPYPDIRRITIGDCFDPFQAWAHTWRLINKQRPGWQYNWRAWNAYTSGAHTKFEPAALDGMKTYRTVMGLPAGVFT